MTRINLLVGGPTDLWPQELTENPLAIPGKWLSADRGTLRLLRLGIIPEIAVGDYDSLSPREFDQVQAQVADIRTAVTDKDDTDTELALVLALQEFHAQQVVIYGATGGRLDHFLDNLFMLLEARFLPFIERIKLVDKQNDFRFFSPGVHSIVSDPDKHYLGFGPLTAVEGLTLYDTKYRLRDADVAQPIMYASNQFTKRSATFSFRSGVVCVIQSSDEAN
ncbi:thiamine diphosphokinase [Loigolactobacillus iwatensis]|uniref:thiamine diphosphokinase n=1 Tax=Loigolactobacillus iwatensis TaxID=1267156 RepID=UPI000F7E4B11|nr:thiamine diphosphokinase [Loigolactobacillus iwatensis]